MEIFKKLIRLSAAAFALSALMVISAAATSDGGGTITATSLNFRNGASLYSDSIALVQSGEKVIITGTSGDWYSVIYNGQSGYMYSDYITRSDTILVNSFAAVVNASSVRFRSGASYDSDTISYLNKNDSVSVTGVSGCWYQVTYNGTTGYIYSDYVTPGTVVSDSETVPAANGTLSDSGLSTESDKIIAYAEQLLGAPYVYGGSSPSGFDCSGFTSYVFKNNGYAITRTCTTQYAQYTHVSRNDLKPGDLVFFASSSSWDTDHVGIYIGNDSFIHASSGSGHVIISDLSGWYYNNYYYGAARVIS